MLRLASLLDGRGQYDLADRLESTTRLAQAQSLQPMFNKLDPSELSNLYQLELRYSELAQRSGPGEEGGDDWPSRAKQALAREVGRIGDRLYDLCRCVNICNEYNIGREAHCPNCMGPTAGGYYENEDDYYDDDEYSGTSMEPDDDDELDAYTCRNCGNRLTLDELDQIFPTGGTEYGQKYISNFMSTWQSLRRDPNALSQRIIAIHYIINAVHGSGPMATMFFSGKTGDIRMQLDQLSGKTETASSRFVRVAADDSYSDWKRQWDEKNRAAEDRVENMGMENAIGELQDEIMGYAPSEDLIISALPFLVGEPGKSQRQHWLTNNPEIIAKWRQELPDQPLIEGSQVSHDRVRDAWDQAMAQHTE